jgi:hypothetical protein
MLLVTCPAPARSASVHPCNIMLDNIVRCLQQHVAGAMLRLSAERKCSVGVSTRFERILQRKAFRYPLVIVAKCKS